MTYVQSISPGDHDMPSMLREISRMHQVATADGDIKLALIADNYLPLAYDTALSALLDGGTLDRTRYWLRSFESGLLRYGHADKYANYEHLTSTVYDLINRLT